jgi:hypothetical protein
MALLHQLLNMKVDWGHARESFSSPHRAGFKSAGDPETCTSLHLPERVEGPFYSCPFIEPYSAPISSYGEDTGAVEHLFVFGPKATHRVYKCEHGPHSSESLVCVAFDMLPECESTIKEEAQVLPSGSWVKGGSHSVWGIATVDVRVAVTMFLGEVESLRLVVFKD